MHKLFIFLVLAIPLTLDAQNFAPIGTQWVYYRVTPPFYEPYEVVVMEDDSILGEYVTIIPEGSLSLNEDFFILDKGDQIYFYSKYNNRFNLLYDFNAEVGDTITINGLGPDSIEDRCRRIITGIEHDSICTGEVRKRWKTDITYEDENGNGMNWEQWGDIIEGVGSVQQLVPVWGLVDDNTEGLRCYDNGTYSCKWVDYPCDSFIIDVKTEELSNKELNVNLNYVEGSWTLDYDISISGEYSFILYNVQGKVLHQEVRLQNKNTKKWFHAFPSGLYLWHILDSAGRQKSGKIIIQ